jgi:hypothetical protein
VRFFSCKSYDAVEAATVTLPDSLDKAQAAQAQTAPLPDADGSLMEPGQMKYSTTFNVQGREINVNVTRTVEEATFEGIPVWRIVDRAKSQRGRRDDLCGGGPRQRGVLRADARRGLLGDAQGRAGAVTRAVRITPH